MFDHQLNLDSIADDMRVASVSIYLRQSTFSTWVVDLKSFLLGTHDPDN